MPSLGLLEVHSVHWRHSQQPQAPWTVCPLADQTLVGGSQASVRAPGLSCRHVTRSTHRASGYQQAAICYSWSRGGLDFLEPNQLQRYIMHQDNTHKTGATSLCNTSYSQRVTQLILHRALVIGRQRGQESCRRSAAQGKGSTVGAKSPRARPCIHIHIFTTPAVRVQHEVTVHVIVKTSVQLGHAVAHLEWVRPPGYEQALRIHVDRLLCQQQHLTFLRAKPWPHRLIYPAASSTTASRWESIRSHRAGNSPDAPPDTDSQTTHGLTSHQ